MNTKKDVKTPDLQDSASGILVERQDIDKRKAQSKRRAAKYKERLDFVLEHGDAFAIAEHQYLYGKDL